MGGGERSAREGAGPATTPAKALERAIAPASKRADALAAARDQK